MLEEEIETAIKVIVVGNGQVGKTSMITRYASGEYTDTYKKTIGTDFMERDLELAATGDQVKLMLWDTAGQEMFSTITRNYYRGAAAVVYVFSTNDRDSFTAIDEWLRKVTEECGTSIRSVLVQNKIDLLSDAQMTPGEVEGLARRLNMKLYRTCVKDGTLVEEVFEYLATSVMESLSNEDPAPVVAAPEIGEMPAPKTGDKKSGTQAAAGSSQSNNVRGGAEKPFKLDDDSKRTSSSERSTRKKRKKTAPCSIA